MDRNDLLRRITERLRNIYGDVASVGLAEEIVQICDDCRVTHESTGKKWDERDAVLITYADSINKRGYKPLEAFKGFADKYLKDRISCVHFLPFFPFSSDDGFSVMDNYTVYKKYGSWDDIKAVGHHFSLMYDFVVNHVSQHSKWFTDFLIGSDKAKDFFIEADPDKDYSDVVRPRSLPLLSKVSKLSGDAHVWTTFSDDQIDLNFGNPKVLVAMLEVLGFYLKNQGRIIRLDAIAYLWKELGTSCLHRPQTHEIVKLFRDFAEAINPQAIILTETNVPNKENLSYFGSGDEAHMIYQFSLPPLLLHALLSSTSHYLQEWAKELPELPANCTYFNFTASHDGIGVRPLEGVLPDNELDDLVKQIVRFGGKVSSRTKGDGTESPYELNITYFDAMKGTVDGEDGKQVQRFICSQAIAMAMQGVPALYIHSLFATPNDYKGAERTGRARSINRKKVYTEDVKLLLKIKDHPTKKVFYRLLELLEIRRMQPAFHPSASQEIINSDNSLFVIKRISETQQLLAISNITGQTIPVNLSDFVEDAVFADVADGAKIDPEVTLKPYGYLWVTVIV